MTAAAFIVIALVGCKGGANDPKSVAIAFMDAMKAKDFDGAAKYATKDSKSALEMMKSAAKMAEAFGGGKSEDMDFDKDWKGKKVEYTEPKIDGDNATLSLMADGKEQMPISLKKEEGKWKVAFDKNTLMKTGMDKMKGDNSMQDMNNSMKNLDGMNDSIKNALNDASKMMNGMGDSIKNVMDSAKKMMEQQH